MDNFGIDNFGLILGYFFNFGIFITFNFGIFITR